MLYWFLPQKQNTKKNFKNYIFVPQTCVYRNEKSVHKFLKIASKDFTCVSEESFKISCPNLKFSDVLEFLRIPLGLNSSLLEDAEAGWRSVWQLEDSISMTSSDPP